MMLYYYGLEEQETHIPSGETEILVGPTMIHVDAHLVERSEMVIRTWFYGKKVESFLWLVYEPKQKIIVGGRKYLGYMMEAQDNTYGRGIQGMNTTLVPISKYKGKLVLARLVSVQPILAILDTATILSSLFDTHCKQSDQLDKRSYNFIVKDVERTLLPVNYEYRSMKTACVLLEMSFRHGSHKLFYLVNANGDGNVMKLRVVGFRNMSFGLLYGSLPRPPEDVHSDFSNLLLYTEAFGFGYTPEFDLKLQHIMSGDILEEARDALRNFYMELEHDSIIPKVLEQNINGNSLDLMVHQVFPKSLAPSIETCDPNQCCLWCCLGVLRVWLPYSWNKKLCKNWSILYELQVELILLNLEVKVSQTGGICYRNYDGGLNVQIQKLCG